LFEGVHGGTDVTGFGLLGHATNLARSQKSIMNFEIHTLPIIRSMKLVDDTVKIWNLSKGTSAETSGKRDIQFSSTHTHSPSSPQVDYCYVWLPIRPMHFVER
jgi:hypothetical protein